MSILLKLPFGLDMRLGLQGLNYQHLEVVLAEVANPHPQLTEYRVRIFPGTENYAIEAITSVFFDRDEALEIYSEIGDQIENKYAPISFFNSYSNFDLSDHIAYELSPPMSNWMFPTVSDGLVSLKWIMLHMIQDDVVGWKIRLTYVFNDSEQNESDDEDFDTL